MCALMICFLFTRSPLVRLHARSTESGDGSGRLTAFPRQSVNNKVVTNRVQAILAPPSGIQVSGSGCIWKGLLRLTRESKSSHFKILAKCVGIDSITALAV